MFKSTIMNDSALWALLLIASTTLVIVEPKPLNVNQVRFRRIPPKEFSAALGSSITLECEASSSPPPAIYWLKNGKRIIQNELDENLVIDPASGLAGKSIVVDDVTRMALSTTKSRLFIDCAGIQDEATYTCVADNEYSQVTTHTKLSLTPIEITPPVVLAIGGQGENEISTNDVSALGALPQCLTEEFRRSQPARIQMWTHNIVEIMKNDVLLYCRSNINTKQQSAQAGGGDTQQRFQVAWTTPEGKEIVNEDSSSRENKYEILETGDLLIRDLAWSDMGSYACTVSDEQSSDTISSFVYPAQVRAATTTTTTTKATTTTTTTPTNSNSDQQQQQQHGTATSCQGNDSSSCKQQRARETQNVR
ncbi:zwei Ig domain zig-4-like [Olea europaea subsp. europaea]|uniref:Zwei Ig domain zig-4-like n=1 Tax=Olea europaea subsp. europaea TaxID=158383 RepID=A0A8S0TND3_OLEEU|nr:zwei Ig domain zig-4-like [Olea europaea subsp. europaea]